MRFVQMKTDVARMDSNVIECNDIALRAKSVPHLMNPGLHTLQWLQVKSSSGHLPFNGHNQNSSEFQVQAEV